jgi:hypothetical protein
MIQNRHHRSPRNTQHGKVGSQLLEQYHELGRAKAAITTVCSYMRHVRPQSSAMSEMPLGIRPLRSQLEGSELPEVQPCKVASKVANIHERRIEP